MALMAQRQGDPFPDGAVVFDQQNSWHGLSIRTSRPGPRLCYRMIIKRMVIIRYRFVIT
ncbi:hypothetical protein SAURM35S_04892 [Streptomyces aurantiogriseus]